MCQLAVCFFRRAVGWRKGTAHPPVGPPPGMGPIAKVVRLGNGLGFQVCPTPNRGKAPWGA